MTTSNRVIAAEAAGGAALASIAGLLIRPDDPWLTGSQLHPAWLVVVVLAARYGGRGLLFALGFVVAALAGCALLAGDSAAVAFAGLDARVRSTTDLAPLAACILVAWIAMLHESRMARMARRLATADQERREADDALAAARDSLLFLRNRHDRIDASLSLWRDLAGRLERGDAAEAAGAALELCTIRAGASAGIVQSWDGTSLRPLARRGHWQPDDPRPRDIIIDRTASAAVTRRLPTPASEVDGASAEDSDVAVPIIDGHSGEVSGVLSLRGVSPSRLTAADLSDLVIVAGWLAPALSRPIAIPLREAL